MDARGIGYSYAYIAISSGLASGQFYLINIKDRPTAEL